MSEEQNLGRLDDEAEAQEPSSTADGPAASGEYDASQGSPHGGAHPIAEEEVHRPAGVKYQSED